MDSRIPPQGGSRRVEDTVRTLAFWAAFTIVWLVILLTQEEQKFTFLNSLFLIMIVVNVWNTLQGIRRNKRIVANGQDPASAGDSKPVKRA